MGFYLITPGSALKCLDLYEGDLEVKNLKKLTCLESFLSTFAIDLFHFDSDYFAMPKSTQYQAMKLAKEKIAANLVQICLLCLFVQPLNCTLRSWLC